MKKAVVLFNLGGPLNRQGVPSFLFSLFCDPAILSIPQPFRFLLAFFISRWRCREAQEIYSHLGGKSPLLDNTQKQADALERLIPGRVFVAMRHAPPQLEDVLPKIAAYDPDEVLLLPLYPQFSTTTTGSFFTHWKKLARRYAFNKKTKVICCYPGSPGFIRALAACVDEKIPLFSQPPRILFSAHGLPEKTVLKGDPYVLQVEETVQNVVKLLKTDLGHKDLDWALAYQSRVGPLKWTQPYIEDELKRAGAQGRSVLLVPVAFVSEHSETLVELDITYRELADCANVPEYHRASTVSVSSDFIQALADLAQNGATQDLECFAVSCFQGYVAGKRSCLCLQ